MKEQMIAELEMDIGIVGDEITHEESMIKYHKRILQEKEELLGKHRFDLDELRTEVAEDKILAKYTVRELLGEGVFHAAHTEYTGEEDPQCLLMYNHGLYISVMDEGYDLVLESEEWESPCLCDLEERLADYAVRCCGITEPETLQK